MTLAKWPNVPGDLAIYWYIVLGDLHLGIARAFGILDRALNRRASRRDPQGVVRR